MTVQDPIFQLDIEKTIGDEFWSNRYYISATSFATAEAPAEEIVNAERQFHADVVTFTKARISSPSPNDDNYNIIVLQQPGQFPTSTSLLPLFNVLRVDFSVGFNRPYRKYYRGCLQEGLVNGSFITNAPFIAEVNSAMQNMVSFNRTVIGTVVQAGVPILRVAMRQLRRGSRRRTTAILPPV